MVTSRQRSSASAALISTDLSLSASKTSKSSQEEWTTKEKLCLASLAIKHGNAWNSVARNMQSFVEKERPEGWSNTKACAAQFDKLMNELGVDKRPKRNEPSDGNSSSVIYKRMVEKRIKELEDNIKSLRKLFINTKSDIDNLDSENTDDIKSEYVKQKSKQTSNQSQSKTLTRSSTGTKSDGDKPPTRALTRRESSRQNLEKTLSNLCREASDIKSINLFCKPSSESERQIYDRVIRKHVDITTIKKRLGSEVDDPFAVINDLMLMFQNAIIFYPQDHNIHKAALELGDKLLPQWEKALLDRFRSKH